MGVAAGTRLGPYEIVSRIGAGGMGEVWRARDTRLDRSVAVKILPNEFAENSELRLRFQREARIISQLSHPNICTLYDVGEGYLVMELLEGESLADRAGRGPIPLREVLRFGAQIAEALDRAHRAGVVHRDLKPGNVMLTRSGAKLLDFGLARSEAKAGEDDVTLQKPLTESGTIPGTVPYMAPEQLEGRQADRRTDIFALGAVLYEMVTGRRAFEGKTRASVIAAIMTSEPAPVSKMQPLAPRALEHLIARCLAKDPEERWQSALDLASELRWISEKGPEDPAGAGPEARRAGPWMIATLVLSVVAVMATGAAVWLGRARVSGGKPETVAVPRLVRLTWNMKSSSPSVAPDGNSFAYVTTASETADEKADIFVRRLAGENPVNLTNGSGADNSSPAFSPDGQRIAFRSERDGGGIFLMGATGESVKRLTTFGYSPAWSPDGSSIAFSSLVSEGGASDAVSSLWVVDVATGKQRKVFEGDAIRPFWSPSGTRLAFDGRQQGMAGGRALFTVAVSGGLPTEVASTPGIGWMTGVWTAEWIWYTNPEKGPPGIWRIRVDEATGRPAGPPEPVLRSTSEIGTNLSATPGASRLLFSAFSREVNLVRWEIDLAKGRVAPEPRSILSGGRPIYYPIPSPDGEWIAISLVDQSDEFREDILLVREATGEIRRLTDDPLRESDYDWAPDGSRIYFCVSAEGKSELWSIRPDGSDRERVLGATPVGEILSVRASPDGQLLYVEAGKAHQPYFFEAGVPAAQRVPTPLPPMSGQGVFFGQDWSSDGRWISGVSRKPDGALDQALVLYDVESKTYRRIADVKVGSGLGCFWLPDSRRILLVSDSGELRIFDRESGLVKRAGSIGHGAYNVSLSRDGRRLFGNKSDRPMTDIWMLDYGPKP